MKLRNGGHRMLETRYEQMSPIQFGIWDITVDLLQEFGSISALNNIESMVLEASILF